MKPIDIMQQDACLFHDNLSVYSSYGGIVLSDQEGANIGEAIGPKNMCCIMKNHGLLTREYCSTGRTSGHVLIYIPQLDELCLSVYTSLDSWTSNAICSFS